jgi:hypothetical protein
MWQVNKRLIVVAWLLGLLAIVATSCSNHRGSAHVGSLRGSKPTETASSPDALYCPTTPEIT